MRVLVVYESMFGNTRQVAEAIATGLRQIANVELRNVADLARRDVDDFDMIVAGGPTHAFSMTRPTTRDDAVKQGAVSATTTTGLREWVSGLPTGRHPQLVATFDTRVDKVRHLPGSAAKSAANALRRRGYTAAMPPESFYVTDTAGPLLPGELQRAQSWGQRLGAEAQQHVARASTPGGHP